MAERWRARVGPSIDQFHIRHVSSVHFGPWAKGSGLVLRQYARHEPAHIKFHCFSSAAVSAAA
jgi:hypothetical protein